MVGDDFNVEGWGGGLRGGGGVNGVDFEHFNVGLYLRGIFCEKRN